MSSFFSFNSDWANCPDPCAIMTAIFNFESMVTVTLLLICTCAYLRGMFPSLLDRNKTGFLGIFWKCARIGERLSPWVAFACISLGIKKLFIS